ncbi:Cof-type HAD-IIB family hydrolase [Sharpea azabuensis]|uniref:Cof-type HAD-IIB family hydrolase n=1 Tax=Sharpea azabuensis TaxID=322505 RepID=UPI0013D8EB24|nr:HAD family hydrolase [Sharpea azabuensis]
MIKMIATDMDGTFLDSNKQFDYEFISLFYRMQEKDIKFVIASGNQFLRLFHQFIPMSEDIYFVADNGAYVGKGAKPLYLDLIEPDKLQACLDVLAKHQNLMVIMSGRKHTHVLKKDEAYLDVVNKHYRNVILHDQFDHIDDDILKLAVYDPTSDIHQYENQLKKLVPDNMSVVTAGNEWVDIQNLGTNKGSGIRYLQKELHIEPEECMAFGDAMNDFTLLKSVKYGIAMANAVDEIKHIAYSQCPSNDQQGVLKVIRQVLDGKFRY